MFSGIQPTGDIHLGNLLGALRQWVAEQDRHEAFYCLVDLHALTRPWQPAALRRQVVATGALLVACGIDPARSVLFVQSQVPAHAELTWVLTCIARMGELRRMIQFKEKSRGEAEGVGVGLFSYPVLQAADVLLYQAHGVPVGEDQRQHIELMRDLGERFNRLLGPTFVLPEPWIPASGARIMALDDPTEKMSKSTDRPDSKLLLVDPPARIAKKIKAAVTDSGREVRAADDKPAVTNLLTIHSLVTGATIEELEERYRGAGYGRFKAELADAVVARLEPVQKRYADLMADPGETERQLAAGARRAAAAAAPTLALVRERAGLLPGESRGPAAGRG